jgi:hypothetical protein
MEIINCNNENSDSSDSDDNSHLTVEEKFIKSSTLYCS